MGFLTRDQHKETGPCVLSISTTWPPYFAVAVGAVIPGGTLTHG